MKSNLQKRLHVKISTEHYDWLVKTSKQFDVSMGKIIRDILQKNVSISELDHSELTPLQFDKNGRLKSICKKCGIKFIND